MRVSERTPRGEDAKRHSGKYKKPPETQRDRQREADVTIPLTVLRWNPTVEGFVVVKGGKRK